MNFRLHRRLAYIYFLIIMLLLLPSCTVNDTSKIDTSIAMVKNATMSTYGTGFAVGIPGHKVDTVITSYSVIASPNGAVPKTAVIRINETEKDLSANVIFYDEGRNIAILRLAEQSKTLKPLVLENNINNNENIYTRGYDGTGNITNDFDKFNTTNIVQYSGNISRDDELNTILIYKYSNEFNRAMVGAPAINAKGNIVGMCAYSLSNMNTYSQYILSSDELSKVLSAHNIDFMTSEEVKYKNIIILSIIFGFLLLAAIICAVIIGNKKENNLKFKDKYIKATDGALKGNIYQFKGKLSIGRDESKCDVVYPINEPGISALHCTLIEKDGDCYLVDNFSKYGTFLNDGKRIEPSSPYKITDKKFTFYVAEPKNQFEFVDKRGI